MISKANNISNRLLIKTGQRLKIPLGGVNASKLADTYTVKKGDSLWLIARRFNTDVETLKRINNLKSSDIAVGQTINLSVANEI